MALPDRKGRRGGRRRGELTTFVDATTAHAADVLQRDFGMPPDKARQAGMAVARAICNAFAKTWMYIPTDLDLQLAERNRELWEQYGQDGPPDATGAQARRYTADRVHELAHQRGMTVQMMYNILREQYQAQVADRQGMLPGLELDVAVLPPA